MKFTIFSFSGTGNTKWIVDNLETKLKDRKHDVSNYSIDSINDNKADLILNAIGESDFIGLAYPLYGANIPRIMRDFIVGLVKISKASKIPTTKLFFINTFYVVNGHGIFEARKLLKESNLKIHSYVNFRMTNSAPSKTKDRALTGEKLPIDKKENTIKKINRMIDSFENDKRFICGIGPHLLMGKVIRIILKNKIRNNYKNMHVDKETCTKCMICVKNCPTKSLIYEGNRFIFNESCEACMRCYNYCPKHSISN